MMVYSPVYSPIYSPLYNLFFSLLVVFPIRPFLLQIPVAVAPTRPSLARIAVFAVYVFELDHLLILLIYFFFLELLFQKQFPFLFPFFSFSIYVLFFLHPSGPLDF